MTAGSQEWRPGLPRGPLSPDIVAVWRIPMETHRPLLPFEWQSLSLDERERADRFKFDEPRIRLVRCRHALRSLLGNWLAINPCDLRFEYGAYGKPSVQGVPCAPSFNVSHSHDWGLIAITATGDLGIDVERIEPRTSWNGLARRFYSPREFAQLEALAPAQQLEGFYRTWTGKEAFIKAIGRGLSFPLANFSVQGDPNQSPQLLAVDDDPSAASTWQMENVSPADRYAATVTWNGASRTVLRLDFRPV